MRVEFFVNRDYRKPQDETTDEYRAANGEYGLDMLPRVGDKVSFDGGDSERSVDSLVIKIDPRTGATSALVQLS